MTCPSDVDAKYINMRTITDYWEANNARLSYVRIMGDRAKSEGWGLGWGIGGHVIFHPSIEAVRKTNPDRVLVKTFFQFFA